MSCWSCKNVLLLSEYVFLFMICIPQLFYGYFMSLFFGHYRTCVLYVGRKDIAPIVTQDITVLNALKDTN